MTQPLWGEVTIGTELTPLTKSPDAMQLFMFSAATWNRHLIHYNSQFARGDGLEDVAVHRALLGAFLAQMLTEWVGTNGYLRQLQWVVRASARVGEQITCRGRVVNKSRDGERKLLGCTVGIWDQHNLQLVDGSATLVLLV
jgi:acyl dehydratase